MELHIKDRIYIPQLLPAQNSFMEYMLTCVSCSVGLRSIYALAIAMIISVITDFYSQQRVGLFHLHTI